MVLGPEVGTFFGVNKTLVTKAYREHNNYVLNKCPKEKLLVYRIGDGWEPLCKFLGEPVPKVDFPWSNRAASVIYELTHHPDYIVSIWFFWHELSQCDAQLTSLTASQIEPK